MTRQLVQIVAFLTILLCSLASGLGVQQYATADGMQRHQSVLSASLDVATQRGGEGSFNRSDAFGPHETLVLHASVTFGGWPEQNKEVAFEIGFPNGATCAVFYNSTDEEGVAWIACRLPYPCNETELNEIFGNWTVMASADVAGTIVMDIVEFEYGWLVEILSIQTGWNLCEEFLPEDAFCRNVPLGVRVEVRTIVYDPMNVTLSVVACDDLDVPFSISYLNYTTTGRTAENVTLPLGLIPAWAYVGIGTVYANALTALPQQGGVGLCPEAQKGFSLLKDRPMVAVPRDYPTIQEAIMHSDCGATILVSAAVYWEHLVIDKPILLVGQGLGNVILEGDGGVGINVTSPYVSIIGITIRNFTVGICFQHTAHNIVYHNNFECNSENLLLSVVCNACLHASTSIVWDNGCEGNYWSNYNGTDLNGDGVGDTYLPWEGVDSYPLDSILWNPADIDHDLDVDIFDFVRCAGAYGSTPAAPKWDPHCDMAEPYGEIDIFDIVFLAGNYGEKYSTR